MCLIHFAKVNEEMQDEINMRLFRAAARGNSWHRHQRLRLQQSDRPRHQKAQKTLRPHREAVQALRKNQTRRIRLQRCDHMHGTAY